MGALLTYSIGIPCFFLLLLVHNRETVCQTDDASLSFEDFVTVVSERGSSRDELRQQFDAIDADGSGTVTMQELIQHTAGTGEVDEAESSAVLTEEDVDGAPDRNQRLDKTAAELAFLTKEYDTEYYWFEIVEYTKKLMMTGVLMKTEQGSSSQIFFGLIISFVYFALVVRALPYRSWPTDVIRVAGELQLFLTMLCVLMLRLDLHQEWMTKDRVSAILIMVNFVMTPFAFVYDIVARMRTFARDVSAMLEAMKERRLERESASALDDGLLAPGGRKPRSRCCKVWMPNWSEMKQLFGKAFELVDDLDATLEERREDEDAHDGTGFVTVINHAVGDSDGDSDEGDDRHVVMDPVSLSADLMWYSTAVSSRTSCVGRWSDAARTPRTSRRTSRCCRASRPQKRRARGCLFPGCG